MTSPLSLAGVVLAAGRSSRMGRSKALLPCLPDAETFVVRIIRTLQAAGLPTVIVVCREDDGALRSELERASVSAQIAINAQPELGQLSSVIVGIERVRLLGAQAAVVMPVDLPQVRSETVARLLDAWRRAPAPIARVTFQGRGGHPVLFREDVFEELRAADPALGAKAVLRRDRTRVLDVAVDDPSVLRDLDRPEDYIAAFGAAPGDPA